jgi:hypothetical protein
MRAGTGERIRSSAGGAMRRRVQNAAASRRVAAIGGA